MTTTVSGSKEAVILLSEFEETEFLETLTSAGTDEDWADFWASEDPTEFLMNGNKLEEISG